MKFIPLDECDIEYKDVCENNPTELMKRIWDKGQELIALLDKNDTLSDRERKFKEEALNNPDAKERALEILDTINNLLLASSPEVVANVLAFLPQTTHLANSIVSSMGIRDSTPQLPKATIHQMYINLRACQEKYYMLSEFGLVNNMPDKVKIKFLPSKSGSYMPKKGGLKLYHYVYDGNTYSSPFAVAKVLNLYEDGMMFLELNEILMDHPDVTLMEY